MIVIVPVETWYKRLQSVDGLSARHHLRLSDIISKPKINIARTLTRKIPTRIPQQVKIVNKRLIP